MAYNISNWKNVKIDNIFLDMGKMKELISAEYIEVDETDLPNLISFYGNGEIDGAMDGDTFSMMGINSMTGECSGTIWETVLIPLLIDASKESGFLKAIIVWEEGDTIERVEISKGIYSEKEIDFDDFQ